MSAPDDPSILDGDALNRRVLHRAEHFLVFDEKLDRWTPGNAALRFDEHLSVYLESELRKRGLSSEDVRQGASVVFATEAETVRGAEFGVLPDPDLDGSTLGPAHGSVCKDPEWSDDEFRQRRNRIRREFRLVAGEISLRRA